MRIQKLQINFAQKTQLFRLVNLLFGCLLQPKQTGIKLGQIIVRQLSNLWNYNNIFVNHFIGAFYVNFIKLSFSTNRKLQKIKGICNDSLEFFNVIGKQRQQRQQQMIPMIVLILRQAHRQMIENFIEIFKFLLLRVRYQIMILEEFDLNYTQAMTHDDFRKTFQVRQNTKQEEQFNKNKRKTDKRYGRNFKKQLAFEMTHSNQVERKLNLSMRMIMLSLQQKDQQRYQCRYIQRLDRQTDWHMKNQDVISICIRAIEINSRLNRF